MKVHRSTLHAVLCVAALQASGCAGATINIGPPTVPFGGAGCVSQRPAPSTGWPTNPNINVLQAAIDAASPGDIIVMAPGSYYFECNVYVTKPLTILGACKGVAVTNAAIGKAIDHDTPRDNCAATGETTIIANGSVAFNGLEGIFVLSSSVTIDGLAFREEGSTWRGMINIASPCANNFYQDIQVLNNYMVGEKISASYQIGGDTGSCTLKNLKYDGNLLKVTGTAAASIYEPLGVRGSTPFVDGPGTHTLIDFTLTNNYLGCNTNSPPETNCRVFNIQNNYLYGTTTIAMNNLYDDDNIDDKNCPFITTEFPIPLQSNNVNLILDECRNTTGAGFCGRSFLSGCDGYKCCDETTNAVGPECCDDLPYDPVSEKCCENGQLVNIVDDCPEFCSDQCYDNYGYEGIAVCTLHDYGGNPSTADAVDDHYHNFCDPDLSKDIIPGITKSDDRLVVKCGCCDTADGVPIRASKKGGHCVYVRNRRLATPEAVGDVKISSKRMNKNGRNIMTSSRNKKNNEREKN